MVKFLNDLKLDILFKYVFGSEDKDSLFLLRTLVEGVAHRVIDHINHKNVEYIRKNSKEKGVRYDILFMDDMSDKFNVEMQNTPLTQYLVKRFGFYAAKLINENVEVGDGYDQLKTNVQIILINQKSDSFI